ncbi:cadherin-87A [Chironomus tepperi]|uniref:cadherin-87A n=1 Tax=Chironomus tepperi TaxID=113505 RepID=UPI00391F4880
MLKILKILSFITLSSINCVSSINKPPYFIPGGDFSSFSIPENFQVGTSVYKLKGYDPEGKKLSYSISGPYFSVERSTGIVKLVKELDRETQNEVETIITITDESDTADEEPNTVSLRRVIPIRDYNDFTPTFLGRPYSSSVLETSKIGTVLKTTPIIVIDKDEGTNSEISLSCHRDDIPEHDSPCDYFDIITVKNADGNYTAEIRILKPLDFETRKSFTLTIIAVDGSRTNPLMSNATVNIIVIDAQDQPPVFHGVPYSATVQENLDPDIPILLVNASDGDIGNPNDVILTLEKEKFGYFKLVRQGKGQAQLMTTDVKIDRENPDILENGGYYTFYVRATESLKNSTLGDSSLSSITVMIQDIDDNIPEFNQPYFNLTIPENLEQDMALPKLSIVVNDRDIKHNSEYNLTISNVENADGIFDIIPKSGQGRTQIIVKVKNPARLDYDVGTEAERTFIFDIIATVNFIPISKTTVEVHLDGINDNFPMFMQSSYRLQVAENTEMGTKIGDIYAVDKDVGKYGKLKYILRGFGSENFITDVDEGGIIVKSHLDYEQQKSYSLSLIARDGGGRESNANVFIDILDLNDNYPQFELTEYYRSIREGSKSFEPQFFVKAHDADGPTQGNGRISYSIESENSISGHVFNINNETGEIYIHSGSVHSSDTFDGNYELMICAMDFGSPPLKNYTKVIIRVGSENQRPIFQGHFASSVESIPGPPFHRISIYENATLGSNLTMVQATDPDGNDKLIRYRLTESSDSFVIDEITGVIKISSYARLDRDKADSYSIIVNAIDSGMPSETSTVTIKVKVLDINNKAPKFRKASYTSYVPERNKGLEVLKVEALDSDLDAKLKYSIIEPIFATTKAGFKLNPTNFDYSSTFKINEDTGSIVLLKNLESSGLYSVTLTIKVQDMNAIDLSKQIDTCEVILYIQSYKESGPIFLNDEWNPIDKKINLKINEEMPVGTTIIEFKATDPYSSDEITEFDMDPQQEFFKIDGHKLVIAKVIDYESIDKTLYKFDVKAISHDSFSVAHMTVEIENVNDNSPIFDHPNYKAAVLENIKDNEIILKVKATDRDAIRNDHDKMTGYSNVEYSLSGANSALFVINENGEIRLAKNQSLDREKLSVVNFHIIATDSYGKPLTVKKSTANVTIDVLDINDCAPKFLNAMKNGIIYAVLSESSLPNTFIIQLETYDADEGPSSEVRYEMVSDGELSNLLSLNPKTGELRTSKFLTGRGRSNPYEIIVRAIDNGSQIPKQQSLFTDQILHIYIGDTFQNDGIPYFIAPTQDDEASIYENSPIGTKVYQVIAKDPDDPTSPSGMLRYRIQDDIDDARYFRIDSHTGLVTNTQLLDREVKSRYNVIIEVSDQGDPVQMSTRVLKINILDVDDEEPAFVREVNAKPIEFSVLEEQSSGIILGNVTAIDRDIGDNGAIDYGIIDGNELEYFKLIIANNSALITTTKPIDREQYSKFLLTIKCFKMSTDWHQRSKSREYDVNDLSQIQVLVNILDIDDHKLEFDRKVYTIGIRNSIPINTIIYKVQAYDLDSDNLPIKYHVMNVSYVSQYHRKDNKFKDDLTSIFELNNRTGEILLAKTVSDFVDGHFILNVHASNNQFSDSEATVKIFIVRDKSIMKFIFTKSPMDVEGKLSKFSEKLQNKLNGTEIELLIFDAQALSKPEQSLDFTSTSACFKLFRNGNSLSAQETKKILNSEDMKNRLRETYIEYSVDSIDLCTFGKESIAQNSIMTSSGNWLVLLAFFVLIASFVSTLAAFCLFRRSDIPMKAPILHHRISNPEDIYGHNGMNDGGAEPIYTIM